MRTLTKRALAATAIAAASLGSCHVWTYMDPRLIATFFGYGSAITITDVYPAF